jgi:hypothetical protein
MDDKAERARPEWMAALNTLAEGATLGKLTRRSDRAQVRSAFDGMHNDLGPITR